MSKDQSDNPSQDPDKDNAIRRFGYLERSLQIILGGTTTVLAGFLSQVWGSAGVPFRTELAESLQTLGSLLAASFLLPFLRLPMEIADRPQSLNAKITFLIWMAWGGVLFCIYGLVLDDLGKTIVRYAKVAS